MTALSLGMVTLVVPDYDEAIAFFVGKLGMRLVVDRQESATKRWVEVGGNGGLRLLLARAASPQQAAAIGNQAGGRVGFFLYTDDFAATHTAMRAKGVAFDGEPRHEGYGSVAVFTDVAGNRWDLIQLAGTEQ
ncbi:VOC family protein [Novosphingobium aquiterrae]|uniref:VOC family protein n=1 Tax=Novosphingobium aquiterrae TaxID=624388 RepID=A0ABV6PJV5_9SPHN